jgi:hypothetical protein
LSAGVDESDYISRGLNRFVERRILLRRGDDDAITNKGISDLVSEYADILGEIAQSTRVTDEVDIFTESSYSVCEYFWDTFAGMTGG